MLSILLLIPIHIKMSHFPGEGGYIGLLGHLYALPYLQGERVEAEEEVVFGQGFMEASDKERQNVHIELPGRQEGSAVEAADAAVQGAGAFGENDH